MSTGRINELRQLCSIMSVMGGEISIEHSANPSLRRIPALPYLLRRGGLILIVRREHRSEKEQLMQISLNVTGFEQMRNIGMLEALANGW